MGSVGGCESASPRNRPSCRLRASPAPPLSGARHPGFRFVDCADRTAPCHPRRSEEHTSELQSLRHLVCRLLLEKKNNALTRRPGNASSSSRAFGGVWIGCGAAVTQTV